MLSNIALLHSTGYSGTKQSSLRYSRGVARKSREQTHIDFGLLLRVSSYPQAH